MMPPALLLVGIGRHRRLWIPLPVLLLWPFWLLGWAVWGLFKAVGISWERPLQAALMAGAHLSGVRVDIDSSNGAHVHVRMI
jgi:hypothetical protein